MFTVENHDIKHTHNEAPTVYPLKELRSKVIYPNAPHSNLRTHQSARQWAWLVSVGGVTVT